MESPSRSCRRGANPAGVFIVGRPTLRARGFISARWCSGSTAMAGTSSMQPAWGQGCPCQGSRRFVALPRPPARKTSPLSVPPQRSPLRVAAGTFASALGRTEIRFTASGGVCAHSTSSRAETRNPGPHALLYFPRQIALRCAGANTEDPPLERRR
jgi:hypothetical protein